MAAKEPYDYLSTITPDYNYTLAIRAQIRITEEGYKNQIIHLADDNTEERITLSTSSMFYISFPWNLLSEADAGTIFELYHDPSKANGIANSFKFAYDGLHTYVVRFDMKLARAGHSVDTWGIENVRMRVLGRIAD